MGINNVKQSTFKLKLIPLILFLFLFINIVSAEEITFNSINLTVENDWVINQTNLLIIETLDKNNNRVDVHTLNLSENYVSLYKKDVGKYNALYFFNETQNLTLTVTAQQYGKFLNQSINITITEKTKDYKDLLDNSWDFVKENWLVFLIVGMFILCLLVVLTIMKLAK